MIKLDRNIPPYTYSSRFFVVTSLLVLFFMGGCSLIPPVQEMSNARQSLQAAKTAGAEVHDSKRYSDAKKLLELASQKMDTGEYAEARNLALEARTIAIKARQVAVIKN